MIQQYFDFLNRQPDDSGLSFWTNEITSCGNDAGCTEVKRINVSAAFYLSIEFQETGYLIERLFKTAYGDANGSSSFGGAHQLRVPVVRLAELMAGQATIGNKVIVGQAGWKETLENNKQNYLAQFINPSRFASLYPDQMPAAVFVDMLNANAGMALSAAERDALASDLLSGIKTRAQVLRTIAEDEALVRAERNRAFVLMQYFGYLRRNPDDAEAGHDYSGYDFWLRKLDEYQGDFIQAEMVKAFLSSAEYRHRFGS